MKELDLLNVSAVHQGEVSPTSALLYVTIKGSSLLLGSAALTKAAEVRQLAEAATAAGLPREDIELIGVHLHKNSGVISSSSSAIYNLRLRARNLELVPGLLGAITAQKHVTLDRIDWDYGASPEEAAWLAQCAQRAAAKAQTLAQALGVPLGPLHRAQEYSNPHMGYVQTMEMDDLRMSKRSSAPVELDVSLAPRTTIEVRVELSYRISNGRGDNE